MIGAIVPVHDEEAHLDACLAAVRRAAAHPALGGEPVRIVVALDRCSDGSAAIAARHGAHAVVPERGNVGRARGAAAAAAIALGARWIASTDADSVVPPDWLHRQLGFACDAFCGVVEVRDWGGYADGVADAFGRAQLRCDDHPHVHGANLGVRADLYLRCGGFPPLPAHEDVALVDALARQGARIARRATPAVATSARRLARAAGGFAAYLGALERRVCGAAGGPLAAGARS
ncbi:glycosyltransferase [Luteimonas sp. RD2P54]|uniref:Glycosyltransferase n=1 Tax=Luteimonas endophytica TaxID=3042023 RepID=A0ABT6JD00_9GAMM|nr:glycosyltransferase [Luteimonas endophytica]MDH5824083.1 glycosyltransferase [Luteimonas endophytica]